MNPVERRTVASLAFIYALRMLGLFLLLPVISVASRDLAGSTPALMGLALGIYGLTQAIFQIPFGYLSDRFGRKPIITLGLVIFALGSVVAALSTTIHGVILGRALQGAGAIAAAIMALVADLTREQQRTKAMASIGGSIGLSFMLALVLGPILEARYGLQGLFWITAVAALLALPVLWWFTPGAINVSRTGDVRFERRRFAGLLKDARLIRFDIGIFALHMALTAFFIVVPLQLVDRFEMPVGEHWKLYIPVLIASVVGMLPILIIAHRGGRYPSMMMVSIALMILAQLVFGLSGATFWMLVAGLWLFFIGFNALEAMLPSLISRLAPAGAKGTVMGVYNSFEFAGIFVGGLLGGWLFGLYGTLGVYLLTAAALGVWLVLVFTSPPLNLLQSVTLRLKEGNEHEPDALLAMLMKLPGVRDGTVMPEQSLVYLKVESREFDAAGLREIPGITMV